MKPFWEKLRHAQQQRGSWLGIALDVLTAHTPLPVQPYDEPMLPFARAIVEATADLACAYVVNPAFYLAEGAAGMVALERIVRLIPEDAVLIFDGAFAGSAHDAPAYARGAFEAFRADAVTVAACASSAALAPFLSARDKGVFFWTDSLLTATQMLEPFLAGEASAAVGVATAHADAEGLRALRAAAPDAVLLIRTEARDLDWQSLAQWGKTRAGVGALVVAAHTVIYASRRVDFAEQARAVALARVQQMRAHGLA